MKRFLRKALIWTARLFAILVISLIAFYAEEDWRGARAWAACQRDLAAQGESLDLRQLAPPGKPEDDLSKVPLFTKEYQENPSQYVGLIMKIPPPPQLSHLDIYLGNEGSYKRPQISNYLEEQSTDLAVWQKFYRSLPEAHLPEQVGTPAQDVLQALSQFDPQLDEIETAVSNPRAYWSIDYEKPYSSPLEGPCSMQNLAGVLFLKAVAHLDNQDVLSAEKDYLFSLNLSRPLAKGCFLSNYIIMAHVHSQTNALLWEGLHRHAWNQAELIEMESALASMDLLSVAQSSFRIERASMLQTMNVIQSPDPETLKKQELTPDENLTVLFQLSMVRPKGWWDQDRRNEALCMQGRLDAINMNQALLDSKAFEERATTSEWKLQLFVLYAPISAMSLASSSGIGKLTARAETYRRLARLACRLEEYRIAHGQYPEKLDDLPDLPAHLNQEVLSEQPLRYQRKGDGYLLYSLGWNQKDDGGVLGKDDREGDWPWPSP